LLLAGLAIAPSAAAGATARQTLSMSVSSHRVLFGHSAALVGRLHGGLVAGRTVVIDARPYGRSAPHRLAAVTTGAGGAFSYRIQPTIQTTYTAHAAGTASAPVTVGVAPRLAVVLLPNGRIRASVTAGRSFAGREIELQQRTASGTWQTVLRKPLGKASIAVLGARLPDSTIRVAMSVNQAGVGYLGAASHPLTFRAKLLTLSAPSLTVLYGHGMTLDGRLVGGKAGEHVAIISRPYGSSAGKRIATVTTGPGGKFTVRVRPTILTTYQARLGAVQASTGVALAVRPTITLTRRTGSLVAHVAAGRALLGRQVELQRRNADGTWQTIAKRPLGKDSTAVFTMTLPHSTFRVAMSVNQAGAGYMGTLTHPFLASAL
jgi:hypothetical protein